MLEFLVRCVPEHVRDVVEQTVGQHHHHHHSNSHSSSNSSSASNYANPHSLIPSSKALTYHSHYANHHPVYFYPNKSHRHALINGYESRSTSHEAFLVRSTFTVQKASINGVRSTVYPPPSIPYRGRRWGREREGGMRDALR